MKKYVRPALVLIFVGIIALALQAQQFDLPRSFSGKVVSIADGDTITVLVDNTQHRIRLQHIDAPESHQDYGTKSKQALADKVFGKTVKVVWRERDKYKRILGEIFLDDRNINLEMTQEGWAWHYLQYSKDPTYAKAEKDAREKMLGLWAGKNPIPPWDFRKGKGVEDPNEGKTDPATFTVYVTSSGAKYHKAGCKFLAKSKNERTLAEVTGKYEPCSVCKPPVLKKH